MRKLLLFTSLLVFSSQLTLAQTSPMLTFEELLEAFKRGYTVKATVYYAKCDLYINEKKSDKPKDGIGGMTVSVFEYVGRSASSNKKAYLVVSETRLTEHPSSNGILLQNIMARIYEDGVTSVSIRLMEPSTYQIRSLERFETTLYDGKNNAAGAYFFVSN